MTRATPFAPIGRLRRHFWHRRNIGGSAHCSRNDGARAGRGCEPRRRTRATFVAVLMLWAVACGDVTNDIELAITSAECTSEELGEVRYVTIELYGISEQAPCALARRCVPVTSDSIVGIVATLAAVPQPLIDVDDPDAHIVAVIGHDTGCLADDDRVMCGETDVANRRQGVLDVQLACGVECDTETIPFCP